METIKKQIEETKKALIEKNIHGADLTLFEELVLENQLVIMEALL